MKLWCEIKYLTTIVFFASLGILFNIGRAGAQSVDKLDTVAYLKSAWAFAGRPWLATHSGLRWDAKRSLWQLDPEWKHVDETAQKAYFLEYGLQPALNQASASHDRSQLNELAQFYLAYLARFTTLGQLRADSDTSVSLELLAGQGEDKNRTLRWVEQSRPRNRLRECSTCNLQFLHPAARLIRIIALLPREDRSADMQAFVRAYAPIICREQVLRFAFTATWNYWGLKGLPPSLVDIWDALALGRKTQKSYQGAMFDRDLWMVAIAAELIGAELADPKFVGLHADLPALRRVVASGIGFLKSKRTTRGDRQNFQGKPVVTDSYFDGDGDDHPDMAFASNTSSAFPAREDTARGRGLSWDASHITRLPILLRSLADTREARRSDFPTVADIRRATAEFDYVEFGGDMSYPLLHNFFNGGDGWYRVNYAGRIGTGYAPANFCESGLASRQCLTPGGLRGWGLLAEWDPDLRSVLEAFIRLAGANDSAHVVFRNRFLTTDRQLFNFRDNSGKLQYPFRLYVLLAELVN